MAFPYTQKLEFPIKNHTADGDGFLKDCTFDDVHWGLHLGEDFNARAATKVRSIGRGRVVYSAIHPGKILKEKGVTKLSRNWGNIIVVAHKNPKTKKLFFSLYGHLGKKIKKRGDSVECGEIIGTIAPAFTPENGFWEQSHLHFAIYVGPYPWTGNDKKRRPLKVLPGYYDSEKQLIKLGWWKNPSEFLSNYLK